MFTATADGRDRHTSLIALLVLLTLLPAACVLWFMNEAVQVQSEASRRTTLESYRAQLRLVRSRVEAHWDARAARLNGTGDPERRFADLVIAEVSDGAIIFDAYGRIAYPDRDALRDLDQKVGLQAALQLSAEIASRGGLALEPGVFQQTALRDVWAFTSADGQTVLLYRAGTIEGMMHDLLHEVTPSGILFNTFAPDQQADREAIAAGAALPGWQLSFFEPLETLPVGRLRREAADDGLYGGRGLRACRHHADRGVHRQHVPPAAAIARLKTDLVAAVSHELRTPLASIRVLVDGLLQTQELDPVKTREYLRDDRQGECAADAHDRELSDVLAAGARPPAASSFAEVAPQSIVDAVVDAVRERLPAEEKIDIDVAPGLPTIRADVDALVTAILNLLDNAYKYTPGEKQIRLRVTRDGDARAVHGRGQRHRHSGRRTEADLPAFLPRRSAAGA